MSRKSLLRFMTCGSVDDGKSTLIGRLLLDAGLVPDDQLEAAKRDSVRHGTMGGELDPALLVDGLQAEREQGITVDVAYRYFSTPTRRFIVADTPGHEQYTRNMATGASVSDLAVLLIDATKGIRNQTRRHAAIIGLLGLKHVVLVVNKMDLVGFDRGRFGQIEDELRQVATDLGLGFALAIPVVARDGDNVLTRSKRMAWYDGPTLLEHLESVEVSPRAATSMRLPVQWIQRPNQEFRGFSGQLAGGEIAVGDKVRVLPSGLASNVTRVLVGDRDVEMAAAGASLTVTLADEVDVSRGDVIASSDTEIGLAEDITAHLLCFTEEKLLKGRAYLLKCATQTISATVSTLHSLDLKTGERTACRQLDLNDIGFGELKLARPLICEPFETCPTLGAFILIDKLSAETVGAGLIRSRARGKTDVVWQEIETSKATRASLKLQRPCCIWFTGLSGAGKSTIANLLEMRLVGTGRHTYLLDGDNVRHGLNRDLGFSDTDRIENIRRVGEVARLMVDAGLIVMVSFISPFRAERQMARALFETGEFLEVFVDTPLEVCEARDPKGLYRKARKGELRNFTGIDSAYEAPLDPEAKLASGSVAPEVLVDQLLELMQQRRIL